MHDDDEQVGKILTRREVLAMFGIAGAGLLSAKAGGQPTPVSSMAPRTAGLTLPACIVRPQQTEGPYFVDEKLDRSDIRSDPGTGVVSAGVPLALAFNVSRVSSGGCAPFAGAIVDVWQCDALGAYSDVSDGRAGFNNVGKKFLRGFQKTGADGVAKFETVYPGWYQGRAVHIHFKIRTSLTSRAKEFTSQVYFDDALNIKVFAQDPYAKKGVAGLIPNARDGIFRGGGSQLLLDAKPQGSGYAATFDIGLNIPA
jgi:protocatechuate 3,4-dioxygenase beta subunit